MQEDFIRLEALEERMPWVRMAKTFVAPEARSNCAARTSVRAVCESARGGHGEGEYIC